MSDIIHLLPDSVANQIAAGEVIQRPASAVKELLENSIDAGASDIKLIIKDAGKTLIQVVDNGCGMSETDARMSFERHATSKITSATDLFAIKTMGFRGEALASIAAIAQVELKTKRVEDEVGTCLRIEGSEIKSHEPCSAPDGTSIAIKNLFFNIPARRKFLKKNSTELRHIITEFQRVALAYPGIKFSFYSDSRQLFILPVTGLKQRIANIFGPAYNNRLIPVDEESTLLRIKGFIGKPEFAKKTRGEQYFFVNKRFIKHAYLNHAIDNAFKELIPSDAFPSYFIYLDIDPGAIDINIHPTKTEVNFENSQAVYAMLMTAVKKAIGRFNIAPSIDFDVERGIDINPLPAGTEVKPPSITIDTNYNPFDTETKGKSQRPAKQSTANWEKLYQPFDGSFTDEREAGTVSGQAVLSGEEDINDNVLENSVFQLHARYVVSSVKSGLLIIDQRRAHERILFEHFLEKLQNQKGSSQQKLFPVTITLSPEDTEIVNEIKNELGVLGFDLEDFGNNSFIINGTPGELQNDDPKTVLEKIIDSFKRNVQGLTKEKNISIARTMAANLSVGYGKKLLQEEMISLIDRLFACKVPEISPSGKPTFRILTMDYFAEQFN